MSIHDQKLFTEKQGQYLAFIYYYTKINGLPPARVNFESYFQVAPSIVNQMITQLEKKNLITRIPINQEPLKSILQKSFYPI